jgi:hypothetical protein
LRRLQAHAREHSIEAIELLGFDWAAEPDAATPDVIPVQAGRGLFEPSVRATAWVAGGSAVFERPRVRLELREHDNDAGRVHVVLVDLALRRPEHLPEALRERAFMDRLVAWSLADAETPTRPCFVSVRKQGRGPLEHSAEIPRPAGGALIFGFEHVLGHRHVHRWVSNQPGG